MIDLSNITLYILLGLMGFISLIVFQWQLQVIRGKTMKNPDGSVDSYKEQKIFYGIAIADLLLSIPVTLVGIIMIFIAPTWGHFLLILVSFWFVWANLMTTATSLKFEKPKITLLWIITFPFGSLVGLAYIIWVILHFETIFLT